MNLRKGKKVAILTAASGITIMAFTGFVFRGRILEQWYFRELECRDWERIHSAIRRLGELRSVRAVPRFFDRIRREPEGDKPPFGYETLGSIPDALGKIGGPATPELIQALEDKNHWVRTFAALALGKIGRPAKEAVPALIRLLKDEDRYEQDVAAHALGAIGEQAEEAVPVLIEFLKEENGDFLRASAAGALGGFGSRARVAVPALMDISKDSNDAVRMAAIKSVERIHDDLQPAR